MKSSVSVNELCEYVLTQVLQKIKPMEKLQIEVPLKIEVPQGYEFDMSEPQTVKFKKIQSITPVNVIDRIKTIDDIFADHGLNAVQFYRECNGLADDEIGYRILKLLVRSLNEGWVPDWDNLQQVKYYPWFYIGGSSVFRFNGCDDWRSITFVGSRLCFKSRALAEYAGKQFEGLYKRFMTR